jgi:hypothetical protein
VVIVDSDNTLYKLTEKVGIETGITRLDATTFELSTINEQELYFLHADICQNPQLRNKIDQLKAIIIYDQEAKIERPDFPNLIFHFKGEEDEQILKNLVSLYLESLYENEVMRSQLISLNAELNETLDHVETQLLRVKKFYQKNIPIRSWSDKGINLFMRYAAGMGNGSEFIDFYEDKNRLIIFTNKSNSYLLSSSILAYYMELKADGSFSQESINQFYENVTNECDRVNSSKNNQDAKVDFLVVTIDLKTKLCEAYSNSGYHLLLTKGSKVIFKDNRTVQREQFQLQRQERILLLSTGFWENWLEKEKTFKVEELMKNQDIRIQDILDEIFYQLKKESEGGFLTTDACSVLIEVDNNAIIQLN